MPIPINQNEIGHDHDDDESPIVHSQSTEEKSGSEFDEPLASEKNLIAKLFKQLGGVFNISKKAWQTTADLERQLIFSLNPKKWPTLKQLRHCSRVFTKLEKRIISVCAIFIMASVIWLGSNRVIAHLASVPVAGGSYTEAMIGQPEFLNPVYSFGSTVDTDITRLVFSGLFKYDQHLKTEPDLASNYVMSTDGRVYTVTIRDGLSWHDGEPLTIDDVVFTFMSIADPDVKSPLRSSFKNIVIEKIDDYNIRFTLKDPYDGFLDLLTVGIIPQHIWGVVPRDQWRRRAENLQPIGNGAWQFNALEKDNNGKIKSYVLSPASISGASPTASAPFLTQITFKFYADVNQALYALSAQNVEGLAMISRADASDLKGNKHLTFHELKLRGQTAIFFNLNNSSPVQDLTVRRALKKAIDKKRLTQEILPDETVMTNGWFGGAPKTQNGTETSTSETADELLTKAGWEKIGAIRKNKNGDILDLTLTVIDHEPDRRVAQFIQEEWRRLGVETKIDLISPPTKDNAQRTVLQPRAYETLLYTVAYGATYDPYPFWHSSQRVDPGLNLSLFGDHEADEAIEKVRRSLNEEEKNQAFSELQKIISDEVPAIVLFTPIRLYAMSDSIKGIDISEIANPADRFISINNWYVNSTWRPKW